jgi:hypothetical protein
MAEQDNVNAHLEESFDRSSRLWLAQRRRPRSIRLTECRLLKRIGRTNEGGLTDEGGLKED